MHTSWGEHSTSQPVWRFLRIQYYSTVQRVVFIILNFLFPHPADEEQNPVVESVSGGVKEQSSTATRQQLNTHDDNMERTIAKKAVTPSGYYQPRQQYTIQYNNRHYIHNKERKTDRKRLIRSHYSKIYESKAVGRRRLRTGREEPKADCDCDAVSPQDWLSSSIPRRSWLSTSGVFSPSVSVGMSVETPESAWGTIDGGVRHGNNRSMWTVWRVRFSVCLSILLPRAIWKARSAMVLSTIAEVFETSCEPVALARIASRAGLRRRQLVATDHRSMLSVFALTT